MGRCSFCEHFDGSKNPFVMGYCDMRGIPVMPGKSSEDCPYYREEATFDDDNDSNDDNDYDW